MAPFQEERSPLKGKIEHKRRLTVMIMGSSGKMRSFRVSRGVLLWATLFLAFFLLFSILAINRFFELHRASQRDRERITHLEEEIASHRKSILKSRQHIALLEDYVRRLEDGTEEVSAHGKTAGAQEEGKPSSTGTLTAAREEPAKGAGILDITDLMIQKEASRMTVTFKLVNVRASEAAVGGYVHVIAADGKATPPKEWSYPNQKLANGIPADYRKGQIFLIQKFKPIIGRFKLGASSETPTHIKILAYDQGGEVILEKDLEVTHAP